MSLNINTSTILVSCLSAFCSISANATPKNAEYLPVELSFINTTTSSAQDESDHNFNCQSGFVITGRRHNGDENGDTWYTCSEPLANGERLTFRETYLSSDIEESDSYFSCPEYSVMTGRKHKGDENGDTRYTCTYIEMNGSPVKIDRYNTYTDGSQKESSSNFSSVPHNMIITGRKHDDDENGKTWMYYAGLKTVGPQEPGEPEENINLIIKNLSSDDIVLNAEFLNEDFSTISISDELIEMNHSYTSPSLFEPRNDENIPQRIEIKTSSDQLIQSYCNIIYTKNDGNISVTDDCDNLDAYLEVNENQSSAVVEVQ